jgi:Cu+-exporting ATPase
MVATGKGATAGVLFRNAEAIEVMRQVDTLVVDKTGTLTEGKPRLVVVEALNGGSDRDLLRLAASVERASEHPLAAAIIDGARERDGRAMISDRVLERADELRADGATVMFVAVEGLVVGLLGVADPIKESTPEAMRQLHREGIRVVMLTGDNRTTAEVVARKLGIDDVTAEILPNQKAEIVSHLQSEGAVVAMAGDGINDAPALAQADVGIAMGTGTDVAMESAGVTLVKGDLRGIVRARRLSRATMRNIRENLFFAFVYNSLGVPVAAGILYPAFGLLLSPMIAAAAMSFSSVSVIGNALRLRRLRI